jgi:hypothetical protein
MSAHADHIEKLIEARKPERYETEMRTAYMRDPSVHSRYNDWTKFKGSADFDAWSRTQRRVLGGEDILHKVEVGNRLNLEARQSASRALATPVEYKKVERTISDSRRSLEDFARLAGFKSDPVDANRWNALVDAARSDAGRRSTKTADVWRETVALAREELKKLPDADARLLERAMDQLTLALDDWNKLIGTVESPTIDKLEAGVSKWQGEQAAIKTVLDRLFSRLDGKLSPAAKYQVPATLQAIVEMSAHQAESRTPPYTYTRMYDRLTEIPGRADPSPEIRTRFDDASGSYKFPARAWDELMIDFKHDQGKKLSNNPALKDRFVQLMGNDRGNLPYVLGPRIDSISRALDEWCQGTKKLTWPADENSFSAVAKVAFEVTQLKDEIGRVATSPEEKALWQDFNKIVDGAVWRVVDQVASFKGA